MRIRIGFFICHCGINIAHRVSVQEVAEFVGGLRDVVVARNYKFMCSDPGQAMIEKDIHEQGLNRVVVASCSPRLHGKTFMAACQRAGLNPYYFQMASVREQVSWVTSDPVAATAKAKVLAAAAVNRVRHHHRLETRHADVYPDVLVVGGGIAGMQASLDIADAGYQVHLVERDSTIGGHMLQFDKTFPTLDCAACIGTPKMVDVAQHPKIQLYSLSEVTEISGFVGNYTATIQRHPRYVKEGVCTGCGECTEACPVSIPNSWDQGLAPRRAIGRTFPQAIPITFNIEKKDRAPCTATCPAGVNVQGYVQLIGQGKYRQAVELILQRLPLPGTLGRICPHPCEAQCRRHQVDAPVAIRDLKRFAADQVDWATLAAPSIIERKEKVAVVGSGPAGLTAAYDLRLKGFQVTLFEARKVLGGMLRLGIPDYRLPPEVLDREINHILGLGIDVRTGHQLGREFTLACLADDGFGAVFIGIGAQDPLPMHIAGEKETDGVTDAIDFLGRVNQGERARPGRQVAVIGGGNVAVDAARTARRLGAAEVTIIYRRSAAEMPAYPEEIAEAREEGIKFQFLCIPVELHAADGRIADLICMRTELGTADSSGRRRPIPVKGSRFHIPCDCLITAVGQKVNLDWTLDHKELSVTPRHTLVVDPQSHQTGLPFLFAAGDLISGPATAIEAIGGAHKAAAAMEAYLDGKDITGFAAATTRAQLSANNWAPIPGNLSPALRARAAHCPTETNVLTFQETSASLEEFQARQEADRCLNCGICSECMECVKVCEAKAIDHTMQAETLDIKVGSIILASGYDIFDPTPMKPFGYGRFANVFTALEFERLSNATGPTGGDILLRDDDGTFTRPPQSVALLHCMGSRDVHYHEYCSRVCCMYALKYTHLLKEKVGPTTSVFDFYIDMRCYGKGYEEFYRRCQEEGTIFIRGRVAEISDQAVTPEEQGRLIVIGEDTLLAERIRIPVDMVVLCTAIEARRDAAALGRVFGVNQGADGFFLEEHPKLAPLNTAMDGVFLAGCCQKPMDIPDTVAQASGAAAKSLALATRGKVAVPPTISAIDPDICIGCKTCLALCPYGAISFNARKGVSEVNPAVCKGCGSCSAFCPSGAAGSRHFTQPQVFAEMDGIFNAMHLLEHDHE